MGITLWHGLQQGPVLDSFKQIVQEWNVAHQQHPVQTLEFTVYDAPAREALAKPEDEQPNLVLAPEYMTSTMLSALKERQIIPIDRLLSKERLDKVAELVKRTFGDAHGRLASLPFNPSCGVLYANADLVKTMPKTLEELEEISDQLMKEGKTGGGYTCAWPAAYLIEIPAAQQEIPLAEPENGKLGYGSYQLGKEWLRDHLLNLRRLHRKGVFVYAGQTNDARKPFVEGKVAFFMQGSTHYPILQKEASFEVTAAPLPTLMQGQTAKFACPLGGASLWVLDNAKTQSMVEGVKEFLDYLASDEIQTRWHQETGYVPVLENLPQELKEFYQDHPIHQAAVEESIEAVPGRYSFGIHMPNYGVARKELFLLIEKILDPNTNEREVMDILKEFDAKYSIEQPSCYKEIFANIKQRIASIFSGHQIVDA